MNVSTSGALALDYAIAVLIHYSSSLSHITLIIDELVMSGVYILHLWRPFHKVLKLKYM